MLTDSDIERIRATWARVAPLSGMASELFYGRLFKLAPDIKPLFKSDLKLQGVKLVATLAYIVDHLDEPEKLNKAATELALRHVGYGVTSDQYAPVGEALIWMIQRMLGAGLTIEDEVAWTTAYAMLADVMVRATDQVDEA